MDTLAEGFKALADPTRLRLLALLLSGERCVCDLMAALDLPQSTVSRHLGFLKKEGWVSGRRAGKWMYYELSLPEPAILRQLMELLRTWLGQEETALRDAQRLRQRLCARSGNCCD